MASIPHGGTLVDLGGECSTLSGLVFSGEAGSSLEVENETLSDDLVGAGKAKLKSAFGKMAKGKISSRQLLNKFVKMVA